MWNPRLLSILMTGLLPVMAVNPNQLAAKDRPLPTHDEVVSRLDETLSSLVTIQCTYVHRQIPNNDGPVDWEAEGVYTGESQWTWVADGEKRAMECDPYRDSQTGNWIHHRLTFDGKQMFDTWFDQDDPDKMSRLKIHAETNHALYFYRPECWLGWRLTWANESVVAVLKRASSHTGSWETLDGHRCLRMDLSEPDNLSPGVTLITLHLDPQQDWLPRKMVLVKEGDSRSEPNVETLLVSRFGQVDDPLLNRQRAFPMGCSSENELIRHEIAVESVRVNQQIPGDSFRIRPQSGTRVIEEMSQDGELIVKNSIHGGPSAVKELRQASTEAAQKMAAEARGDVVVATPSTDLTSSIGWAIGIVCAVAAMITWWRQQR